ncbi:phosphatidate cytidylyltransferase [Sandaracinobacter sp. RS1-74]|uniref:phosphatidate cytidylyltransferase n=1 Tax=Sandaracinobacteroides sayramensis TaxID=2913411 RepID=UPI001ED9F9C8|nr:phosphatidate cytidylyltransferase [Sandaracinobacteroides sayramensis]MCG2841651.1 phosphatidate cytidylyltransferase [Sandaracinobacteroides sayramensis]
MAAAEPKAAGAGSGLGPRVVVGLFLAVIAIADIWVGGPAFSLMIAAGVILILWEWCAMHRIAQGWRIGGGLALAAVALLADRNQPQLALVLLLSSAILFLALSLLAKAAARRWISTGLLYAGLPAIALIWLRGQPDGFALVMWTMGLVWATDIFAYFAGRAIGGPKIWPAVSPNKTWAGLIGGMTGAALFSLGFAVWRNWPQGALAMLLLGAALAVVAQAGDFFESWLKRRAGVKDSGRLFPGHGGIMDRVDGLVPVACLVALWAATRTPVEWVSAGWEALA